MGGAAQGVQQAAEQCCQFVFSPQLNGRFDTRQQKGMTVESVNPLIRRPLSVGLGVFMPEFMVVVQNLIEIPAIEHEQVPPGVVGITAHIHALCEKIPHHDLRSSK